MKKFFLMLLSATLILTTSACSSKQQEAGTNASATHEENAQHETQKDVFDVVFQDYDGTVLKSEKVPKKQAASPPVGLKRPGHKFVKWDKNYDQVTEDLVVTAVYQEITAPTLVVDTVYAKGQDVTVAVSIEKNPGILSLLLNTIYVENAMTLTSIESGSAMKGYTFVAPKNTNNACNAAWYIVDVPDEIKDGDVALLHFKLKENVYPGAYEISVSCDNGAFNDRYEAINFETIKGYVIVEREEETK